MNNFCNNCGAKGHVFQQCKNPITSNGVLLFDNTTDTPKYLMIRRKDTLGFVDFMRGKYDVRNLKYILNIINEMTIIEKVSILKKDFDMLWNNLWGNYVGNQYKSEKNIAMEKFNILKVGIVVNGIYYNLRKLINKSNTKWHEPEWGFPKGRRNFMENDIKCALREFEEETGYSKNSIRIINNILPFEEVFVGSNYKSYKHSYFIAKLIRHDITPGMLGRFESSEVSKVEWKTYDDAKASIRDYNIERKELLDNIHDVLTNYEISDIS